MDTALLKNARIFADLEDDELERIADEVCNLLNAQSLVVVRKNQCVTFFL